MFADDVLVYGQATIQEANSSSITFVLSHVKFQTGPNLPFFLVLMLLKLLFKRLSKFFLFLPWIAISPILVIRLFFLPKNRTVAYSFVLDKFMNAYKPNMLSHAAGLELIRSVVPRYSCLLYG